MDKKTIFIQKFLKKSRKIDKLTKNGGQKKSQKVVKNKSKNNT